MDWFDMVFGVIGIVVLGYITYVIYTITSVGGQVILLHNAVLIRVPF